MDGANIYIKTLKYYNRLIDLYRISNEIILTFATTLAPAAAVSGCFNPLDQQFPVLGCAEPQAKHFRFQSGLRGRDQALLPAAQRNKHAQFGPKMQSGLQHSRQYGCSIFLSRARSYFPVD
jgi:hypothetical protein